MKYFVIDDVRVKKYSVFGSSICKMANTPAIIAVRDKDCECLPDGNISTDGIVYADGSFRFVYNTRIWSAGTIREATPEEVKRLTDCAASVNLHYTMLTQVNENPWTKAKWTNQYEGIAYISNEAMRFKLNGEIVGWKEIEAYEPEEGRHFAWFHDNGYSYIGVDPAKKESWIQAVRKLERPFWTNIHGIDFLENGVINVRTCSKPYHEVSNS